MGRERLDQMLVRRGLNPTRSRAQDLIRLGHVLIDGRVAIRAGELVDETQEISLVGEAHRYVSRGALKLIAALDAFGLSPQRRIALDLGASTGGFTEVLLERGAARVYAADVGRGQLHARLRGDARVVSLEGRDARSLTRADLAKPAEAITADLSFISLALVLPQVLDLAAPGAWLVALVKPQFESGREAVGKGGIVRDPADRERALERVKACVSDQPSWSILGAIISPITGQDGNVEWLLGARRKS